MTGELRTFKPALGAVGLTVLKDARVFGAPIAPVGREAGFIAIGNLALPTSRGGAGSCSAAGWGRDTFHHGGLVLGPSHRPRALGGNPRAPGDER